jgi:chorismate synthase
MNTWECRLLENMADLEQFVDLEIAVWGLDLRHAVPSSLLHAITLNGGLVIGTYDQNEMIGMAFAFPARRGKKWLLWSHMAGVRPDYQGRGVGFALKQFQRSWALENGYTTIGWTFDPLQRGNANFNLRLLGATAQTYHVNLYGDMTDGINAGLPSDRLEVNWDLQRKPDTEPPSYDPDFPDNFLLYANSDLFPQPNQSLEPVSRSYFVEIPPNLADLKRTSPGAALAWRLALRQALQTAFASGYIAVDFTTVQNRCCYVLTAPQHWYLYVLECGDQSLYTGITADLRRRLKQHNAGRGAAYTASRLPVRRIGAWQFNNRSDALKAEAAFKSYPRLKKLRLVNQALPYRDAPFIPPEEE